MSTSTPSRQAPQVQHSFDGDVKILNATFDRRMEIRKALSAFQQDLQRIEGRPTQIKADIKLRVGGDDNDAKEHTYTISITSADFDEQAFTGSLQSPGDKTAGTAPNANGTSVESPAAARPVNGQQPTPAQTSPRPNSQRADREDEVFEIRPFKRQRTGNASDSPVVTQSDDSSQVEKLFNFMKSWHDEWVRQGGWLFDNITKVNTSSVDNKNEVQKRLDGVQNVLGQSINYANASTMNELSSITKLLPWLEQCRKTSADKVQAREEKWRSSSATFHDQTRRDREAAEKRIEKRLEEQREVLMKLARASGIEAAELEASEEEGRGSREESLGAQLTAELNMEAAKSENATKIEIESGTIDVDDD